MTPAVRLSVSVVCAAIAAFLVVATWLPAERGLRRGEASVAGIVRMSNTWHEVELLASVLVGPMLLLAAAVWRREA
jgi:hypothetical protein